MYYEVKTYVVRPHYIFLIYPQKKKKKKRCGYSLDEPLQSTFFLFGLYGPFKNNDVKLIVHQRWAKTGESRKTT